MKLLTSLLMGLCVSFQALTVLSAAVSSPSAEIDRATDASLIQECGSLGVMSVPTGMDASTVRHCADHPLGRDRDLVAESGGADLDAADSTSKRTTDIDLAERADDDATTTDDKSPEAIFGMPQSCNYGPPYGCHRHWCWRECGPHDKHFWCWIAEGNGGGPWRRCNWDWDCRPETGGNCGIGCGSCGCSC